MEHISNHYTHLADAYDYIWSEYPWSEYVPWMNRNLAQRVSLSRGERAADIGAGTGIFIQDLMQDLDAGTPLLCVDPSQEMLDKLPNDPRLSKIEATVEDLMAGSADLPYEQLDVILSKEAIHHADDLPKAVAHLARRLAPGGRFLIVTLPPLLDYPVFGEAYDLFARKWPQPADIAAHMESAGLRTSLSYDQFPVTCSRQHYLHLMERRWLSVLSAFDEQQFRTGMSELERLHPEETFVFVERRAFIMGHAEP